MLRLCLDTSYKFLVISLIKDNKVINYYQEECFKKQSEMVFIKLEEIFKRNKINPLEIDEVAITEGPGSYTGVRIAMSIAKIICSLRNIPLYTINTLKLLSNSEKETAVLLDARSNRVYLGVYDENKILLEAGIYSLEDAKEIVKDKNLYGDLSLLGEMDRYPEIYNSFLLAYDQFVKTENIHTLTPLYLKDIEAYRVDK